MELPSLGHHRDEQGSYGHCTACLQGDIFDCAEVGNPTQFEKWVHERLDWIRDDLQEQIDAIERELP